MNRAFAVLAVSGLAAVANAQDSFRINLQVNDGGNWVDSINAAPGQAVQVRAVFSVTRAAGFVSIGGAQITQIDVNGTSGAGDAVSAFGGLLSPGTQTFSYFNGGTATAKIDRLDNPTGSIQLAQNPVNSGGVTGNDLVFLTFTYTPDATLGERNLELEGTSTAGRITLANVFTTAGGSSAAMTTVASFDGARINVVPAPGALALAGLGGLAAARRRRA